MRTTRLRFRNKSGQELSAQLESPVSGKPRAYAIFAHCFTCSKNLLAVSHISNSLTANNIAVLRFDFTGLGQSEGEFADTNFASNLDDLEAAYEFLDATYEAPQLVIGHSLGGAAVLHVAGKLNKVKAVVTIGSPSDPPHVKHLLKEDIDQIESEGQATVDIGGRPFKIKKHFLEALEAHDTDALINNLDKALLILHSPQDQIVGIENAAQIYASAKHPKSFVTLDGADHLMTRKEDALYVGHMIAAWASRYIEVKYQPILETDGDVLTRTSSGSFTTEILAGDHFMLADEPAEVGGTDLGPTPYGLLTAALGACTSMTLKMYADRKKWDLKEVSVHLTHDKRYHNDCENCEQSAAKIDHFDREIVLEGDLDSEQRKKLLEIADKCPVHRTLHSEIKVNTSLKE